MIKMLPRQIELEKKMNNPKAKKEVEEVTVNKVSDVIEIDFDESAGRFAKARHPIKVADEILVEKAHCATLFEKFAKSHCQNCITM